MLQQVLVLEQELVHTSLGLQPCRCFCCQLVLQQVDLGQETAGEHGEMPLEDGGL